MPVTYLKGAGAAIGRGAEAFEAQQGQHAESTSSFEAAMQTSRYPSSTLYCQSYLVLLGRLLVWSSPWGFLASPQVSRSWEV